jgi:uncharacterized protein (TIGR02231 family)
MTAFDGDSPSRPSIEAQGASMLSAFFLVLVADPTVVSSKIEDVTLYGSTALVHRTARVGGSGVFVVRGLPQAMDPNNVRVRCAGGDVVSVEVRDRLQETVPNERVQSIRERLKILGRELQAARDEVEVQKAMGEHLAALLRQDQGTHRSDVSSGKPDPTAWAQNYEFLAKKIAENKAAQREAQWKADEKLQDHQETEREIGRLSGTGGVTVRDVIVDVAAERESTLDVEYFVNGTGWQPSYDLRAASDLSKVELAYRAKIWQRTGEDWNDVAIALSTAQPQRGAQGPEPKPIWISIAQPNAHVLGYAGDVVEESRAARLAEKKASADSLERDDDATKAPFADVEKQGLSVRFKLARRESVESREQPTTVLVGRADLSVAAERHCTPALDPTVWLRGRTKNTSEWTLLPGNAAVFLGADYLGLAQIETVQPGQELTLHLGADPGVTVERTQIEDQAKGPGFLSSRASKVESWRIHLENHGTLTNAKDGSVDVYVRESLPRSRDERVEVELTKSDPKVSKDDRWKQDLEEKGIQTWIVHVPKSGNANILFQTTITHPKGVELVRN